MSFGIITDIQSTRVDWEKARDEIPTAKKNIEGTKRLDY